MFTKALLVVLSASSLVAGHGRLNSLQGNLGGNGTALGIQGAVVQTTGPNKATELDTTVFGSTKIQTNGLGQTTGQGKVKVAQIDQAMALSGDTLPQASPGGTLTGVFHVVTSDGCGGVKAVIDPTGTGKFADGSMLTTTQDVPGTNGNCPRSITKKSFVRDVLERSGMIQRRATNVDMDFPVSFTLPADVTSCSGTMGNVQGVCLVKIANNNNAGPFGGVAPIQIGGSNGTSTQPPPAAAAPPATGAGTGATGATGRRKAREFSA